MKDSSSLINMALALSNEFDIINASTEGWSSGQMAISISVGSNSRGTSADIHIQNNRFSDLIKQFPVLDEYSRVQIKKMDANAYHVHYVLPSYEDKVGIITIIHTLDQLVAIFGQDAMEHILILT